MVTARAGAVIIQPNLATPLAVDLAGQHHLPSISLWRAFAHAGGLLSYGAHEEAAYRRIAVYADRLLKGAKPADLPMEQPTKFALVINLETAQALGLTIPANIHFQANEVIR